MKRTYNTGLDVETLPPAEDVARAKAILDLFPDEWYAVGAEPRPEKFVERGGETFPMGYAGMVFYCFTGNQKSDYYAGFILTPSGLNSVLDNHAFLEAYLACVRSSLARAQAGKAVA